MAPARDYLRLMSRDRRDRDPQGTPRRELAIAVAGGATAGSTLCGIIIAVGNIGDFQALGLIEAALPTSRYLASTAIAIGATTIALILTLLSIDLTTEIDFSDQHIALTVPRRWRSSGRTATPCTTPWREPPRSSVDP